jgi:hypothetical protein
MTKNICFLIDLNGTFDGHPEPMNPNFPGLDGLAIISGTFFIKIIHCNFRNHKNLCFLIELDGASRLESNSLELRQSQGM